LGLQRTQERDGGFERVWTVVVFAVREAFELRPEHLGQVVGEAEPAVGDEGLEGGDAGFLVAGVVDLPDGELPERRL
jgi:hypothetical protein